jgi:3-methyladenine DNA glycosylase AlkD
VTVPHPFTEAVRTELAHHGDPERAAAQQAYMKSAMPYHGLPAPRLRAVLRPLLADPALQPTDRTAWEATVRELWDDATHREERYAATALTGHRSARGWQDPDALALYRHLVVTGAWWDHVDELAAHRVGPVLLHHRDAVTPVVRRWATEDDLWLRRTAVLSQLTFGERTDRDLLEHAVSSNADDPSFWLRKAIGWALRQYARTDPAWVRAVVDRYGERLSPLSRREATRHL